MAQRVAPTHRSLILEAPRRLLAEAAHTSRRMSPLAGEVMVLIGPLVDERVGLEVFHVDEVAEIRLPDEPRPRRWGFVALTSQGVGVGWRFGWRRRHTGRRWLAPDDVTELVWHDQGVRLTTDDGDIELAWRPGSVQRIDTEAAFARYAPLR